MGGEVWRRSEKPSYHVARWDGSIEGAAEVVEFVESMGGGAWFRSPFEIGGGGFPSGMLQIGLNPNEKYVNPGDCVVFWGEGDFRVFPLPIFELVFERVR